MVKAPTAANVSSRNIPGVPRKMPGRSSARNSASAAAIDQPAANEIRNPRIITIAVRPARPSVRRRRVYDIQITRRATPGGWHAERCGSVSVVATPATPADRGVADIDQPPLRATRCGHHAPARAAAVAVVSAVETEARANKCSADERTAPSPPGTADNATSADPTGAADKATSADKTRAADKSGTPDSRRANESAARADESAARADETGAAHAANAWTAAASALCISTGGEARNHDHGCSERYQNLFLHGRLHPRARFAIGGMVPNALACDH